MFLLYNRKKIFYSSLLILLIFSIEFILHDMKIPFLSLRQYPLKIDLIFVLLTFFVFYFERNYLIIYLACLLGLFQGFVTMSSDFGLIAFFKSTFIFLLTVIKNYNTLWNIYLKNLSVLLIYFLYFFFLYIIIYDPSLYNQIMNIIIFSLIQASILFFIFFIFNKILFNSKIF